MIKVIEFPDDERAAATKQMLVDWLNAQCFPPSLADAQTPRFDADTLFARHTTRPVWWVSVTGLGAAIPQSVRAAMIEQVGQPGQPGPLLQSIRASYLEVNDLVSAGYLEPYHLPTQ